MAQLALYKGKGLIGNAVIRWWTNSIYSHCELVVGGVCYSSSLMDGGVRGKVIDLKPEHWDVIDLPEHFDALILAHFESTKGLPYGWLDLIRAQMFNTAANQGGADFCSEWCGAAMGLPNATIFSPRTLGELVRALLAPPWRHDVLNQGGV